MARIFQKALFGGQIVNFDDANLSIASSAVLYGLSIYTVLPVFVDNQDELLAFRLADHYRRLQDSAKIIGLDFKMSFNRFSRELGELLTANEIKEDVFVRASLHVDQMLVGTRSRGLHTVLSMFVYEAEPILPSSGARLKTSIWRRVPDDAIPARAKVNGAYVNSVLGKQDALDNGCDDCIFLDDNGHVCELSAANIFLVRGGRLITPDKSSDSLEGINRRVVIETAKDLNLPVEERPVDLTELYIADEVFACGTSAFIAPVIEVDARTIATGKPGPLTSRLRKIHDSLLRGASPEYVTWIAKTKAEQLTTP